MRRCTYHRRGQLCCNHMVFHSLMQRRRQQVSPGPQPAGTGPKAHTAPGPGPKGLLPDAGQVRTMPEWAQPSHALLHLSMACKILGDVSRQLLSATHSTSPLPSGGLGPHFILASYEPSRTYRVPSPLTTYNLLTQNHAHQFLKAGCSKCHF